MVLKLVLSCVFVGGVRSDSPDELLDLILVWKDPFGGKRKVPGFCLAHPLDRK